MPLDRYREKRDFEHTPEPDGRAHAESGSRPIFVIQKHAASRLHYDVRLEVGGVLASWAVPKGPSLDPHDKRLAVHVEDHPVEYAGFEGVIPQGEYGGGTVMVWDRGTYEPENDIVAGLEKGDVKFRLFGEKLGGSWALVRMKPRPGEKAENWLLIKHRDEFARDAGEYDVTVEQPDSAASGRTMQRIAEESAPETEDGLPGGTAPEGSGQADDPFPDDASMQLATLAGAAPDGPGWLHEVKYDGYRLRVALRDGRARVLTRTGADWTDRFGPLADAVSALPVRSALLDGEIVAVRPNGLSDFGELQAALADGQPEHLVYQAFDLLYLNGRDLRALPLRDRKELLETLVATAAPGSPLRYTAHVEASGPDFLGAACAASLEGAVSKRGDRPYVAGRSPDWLKTKCLLRQEFVVVGWTEPGGSRTGFGALLLGVNEGDTLRYAGRVGTGFSGRDLASMRERLDALATASAPLEVPPSVARLSPHWVDPELVVEVAFREWTREGVVRQPSFKGLREDKPAKDVVAEGRTDEEGPGGAQVADATPTGAGAAVGVAGVTLTNPGKVLYPGDADPSRGITKLDLARYYESIADHVLPHLTGRPLTLVRCPHGRARDCFYQKHPDAKGGFPASLHTFTIEERSGEQTYFYLDDLTGLISLVQLGALELHAWNSMADDPGRPDRIVFDLDPGPGVEWEQVCDAARTVRGALGALGLASFVKTTGGKGLHVVTPIVASRGYDEVRAFAHALVDTLSAADPRHFTSRMAKDLRPGRVFVDYLRNSHGATAVAAYSTRARPGAPVSVPVSWDELTGGLDPATFTTSTVPERLGTLERDPWEGYDGARAVLEDAMIAAVSAAPDARETRSAR